MSQDYTYLDQQPRPGSNLYRLKMIEQDGTFAYSSIKNICLDNKEMIIAYQNPTEGPVQLKVNDRKRVNSVTAFGVSGKRAFLKRILSTQKSFRSPP